MDPISISILGKIRQQEILDECLGTQGESEIKQRLAAVWQRVTLLISSLNSRANQSQTANAECSDTFATSH